MSNWLLDCFVDETSLPQGIHGFIQLLYLFCLYAYLYTLGCTYLNKANDKLLIFPKNESLVGSVIIPLLSSFPDVIVIFASAFSKFNDVSTYMGIGVGAMAGNVNFGMTVPFILGIWFSSIPLSKLGFPDYKQKNKKASIWKSGCGTSEIVKYNNILIAVSLIPLLILLISSFVMGTYTGKENPHFRIVLLIVFVMATGMFCIYLLVEYFYFGRSELTVQRRELLLIDNIESGLLSLYDVFYQLLYSPHSKRSVVNYKLFMSIVKRFFNQYSFVPADISNDCDLTTILGDTSSSPTSPFVKGVKDSCRSTPGEQSIDMDTSPLKEAGTTPNTMDRRRVVDLYSLKCLFQDVGCKVNLTDLYRITNQSLFDFEAFYDLLIDCFTMSLVGDLNLNIEDTPRNEGQLDTTLLDSNDLAINLNDQVQYSFVDEDVANVHTDRFYSIKHHLMSEDYYRADNEAEDRLLLVSNVDAEFIKRSQLCTDSASTSIVDEIRDYAPDQQQHAMWKYSCYYLILGGIHANIWCYPLCNALGELSMRMGVSTFFAGYVFSAVIAYWSDYFDIPRWAKRKSIRSTTCILCYLQGSIIVMNSLDIACFCGIMYFRRIRWEFTSAILSMLVTETVLWCIASQEVIKKWNALIVAGVVPLVMALNYYLPQLGIL